MNIAIIGFMGVGKTTVGRLVADKLGMNFVDIDDEIVKRAGMSIKAIFEEEGEETFRELERLITKEVSALDGFVIACGGGTVLNKENLRDLKRKSFLILLEAAPESIQDRVKEDSSRPLMNVNDKLNRIKELIAFRTPIYLEAADASIDTSHLSLEEVAEKIELYYREWNGV